MALTTYYKLSQFRVHALRVAMVLVCLSVSLGNSLALRILNPQFGLVSESMPEEAPTEEVPVETHVPCELVELDGFTRHRPYQWQRRQAAATFRHFLSLAHGPSSPGNRAQYRARANELSSRNGCGSTLRC